MPIRFAIDESRTYFASEFDGRVTDDELNASYRAFYESGEWDPEMNELVDLSAADLKQITSEGLLRLQAYGRALFVNLGVENRRAAVYAPEDTPLGVVQVYEALAHESPETIRVFRALDEAKQWAAGT